MKTETFVANFQRDDNGYSRVDRPGSSTSGRNSVYKELDKKQAESLGARVKIVSITDTIFPNEIFADGGKTLIAVPHITRVVVYED